MLVWSVLKEDANTDNKVSIKVNWPRSNGSQLQRGHGGPHTGLGAMEKTAKCCVPPLGRPATWQPREPVVAKPLAVATTPVASGGHVERQRKPA